MSLSVDATRLSLLQVANNYYRPDLKKAALARLSVVHRSLKVAKSGVKKRNRQAVKVHGRKWEKEYVGYESFMIRSESGGLINYSVLFLVLRGLLDFIVGFWLVLCCYILVDIRYWVYSIAVSFWSKWLWKETQFHFISYLFPCCSMFAHGLLY